MRRDGRSGIALRRITFVLGAPILATCLVASLVSAAKVSGKNGDIIKAIPLLAKSASILQENAGTRHKDEQRTLKLDWLLFPERDCSKMPRDFENLCNTLQRHEDGKTFRDDTNFGALQSLLSTAKVKSDGTGHSAKSLAEEDYGRWARYYAYNLVLKGEITESSRLLLNYVRSLPEDSPGRVGEVHSTLQLLSFIMAALMKEDDLQPFRASLEPTIFPIDALVDCGYYMSVEHYAWLRNAEFSFEGVWQRVDLCLAGNSDLVRAEALLLAATAHRWKPIIASDVPRLIEATNKLVALIPDHPYTREMLREHLRHCLGPAFCPTDALKEFFAFAELPQKEGDMNVLDGMMAVGLVLEQLPVSNEVKALMNSDPAIQFVRKLKADAEAMSGSGIEVAQIRDACIEEVVRLAEASTDIDLRDFALRVLVDHEKNTLSPTLPAEIKARILALFDSGSEGAPITVDGFEVTRIDTARAQYACFVERIEEGNLDEVQDLIEILSGQDRYSDPLDINYYERIPIYISGYAYRLAEEGRHTEAAVLLSQLASSFPSSCMGDKWKNDAEFLQSIPALRTELAGESASN